MMGEDDAEVSKVASETAAMEVATAAAASAADTTGRDGRYDSGDSGKEQPVYHGDSARELMKTKELPLRQELQSVFWSCLTNKWSRLVGPLLKANSKRP